MTPKETQAALDEAIADVARAFEWSGVVVGWVVLASVVDADDTSGVEIIVQDGHMAWGSTLGTVEMGRLRLQQQFLAGED